MSTELPDQRNVSRRGFLAASATGVAVTAAPTVAAFAMPGTAAAAVPVEASIPAPSEPITAYVRDAQRSEVTVMSGTGEATFHDPALTKRLLDAAAQIDETEAGA